MSPARSVAGTRTERNLLAAFAGESQATNRYQFAAKQAKKDGLVAVSRVFETLAVQEQVHAKRFFSFLEGGVLELKASYPAGVEGSTIERLEMSIKGEEEECDDLYPKFADIAREEGFPEIAACFTNIASAERGHAQRLKKLLDDCKKGYFVSEDPIMWRCLQCGYVHIGPRAPGACPSCLANQSMFERLDYQAKIPMKRSSDEETIESKRM